MSTKVSNLKGAWPDIITMISAHEDQGSMKRKEKLFQAMITSYCCQEGGGLGLDDGGGGGGGVKIA